MATYKVLLKPSIEKDLRPLPKSTVARIMKRIRALSDDPFPDQSIKLAGTEQLYRLRVGDYRIVYGVDKAAGRALCPAPLFQHAVNRYPTLNQLVFVSFARTHGDQYHAEVNVFEPEADTFMIGSPFR